jgi:nucleolin
VRGAGQTEKIGLARAGWVRYRGTIVKRSPVLLASLLLVSCGVSPAPPPPATADPAARPEPAPDTSATATKTAPPAPPDAPAPASDAIVYVGNLPYDATAEEVERLIRGTGAGDTRRVFLPLDVDGRQRGFAFVTMASSKAAHDAVEALQGKDLRGRRLVANLARPKGAPR